MKCIWRGSPPPLPISPLPSPLPLAIKRFFQPFLTTVIPDKILRNYLLPQTHTHTPLFAGNKAKGRISKQVLQKNKAGQIFQKRKNVRFYKKFGVLCFLQTLVLRLALLPSFKDL